MAFDCIVAGAYQRYDGVRTRLHHLAARFAQRVPLLFVEEPFYGSPERDVLSEPAKGVTVLRPMRRSFDTPAVDEITLATIREWVAGRNPLLWLSTSAMSELADALSDAPLAYDCARDLAALPYVSLDLRVKERALVERADVVFASSRTLHDMYERYGEHVRIAPSGVEFKRFAQAKRRGPHPLLRTLARPIAGYFGTIDERIDFEIIRALGESGASVVLVGPLARIDPAVLPRRPNIHFTGQIGYDELPSLLVGFDVALVPFTPSAAAGIVPQKVPEYAAGGKPIVASPLAEVAVEWADTVTIAETPESFALACETAANRRDKSRLDAGTARARALDWDALADQMFEVPAAGELG